MSTIQVLSPGLLSTIQDGGRKGFRKFGVPLSGSMDAHSADLANILLNNTMDTPVLEITVQGPTLKFNCATIMSIVGADISPTINDKEIERNKILEVNKGDQLSFGKLISGCRCYLAVKDGFDVEKVFGSYSYYSGICDSNILKSGTVLKIKEYKYNVGSYVSVKVDDHHLTSKIIHAQKGPEFSLLSKQQQEFVLGNDFRVSPKNNRMGYQLEGHSIKIEKGFNMLTAVTIPGTVQLTPAGNPIVLMRDCQTTGGYPRILQLTEKGINLLAQKKTNDTIRFELK